MATTIVRTPIVDDDGSGTTGTVLDNAWKQELYGQIDGLAAGLGGAGGSGPHTMLSATHTDTVPGALAAGDLLFASGAPAALTRLPKGADGSLLSLASGLPAWAVPSAGVWQPITYSAGLFTASGSMLWTVSAAPPTLHYTIIGRTAIVFFNIPGAIAGTASTDLFITLPFNPTVSTPGVCRIAGVSAILTLSYFLVGQSKIGFQPFAGGNHTIGASVNVQGSAICQV